MRRQVKTGCWIPDAPSIGLPADLRHWTVADWLSRRGRVRHYRHLMVRGGGEKIMVAVAHAMLMIAYHVLNAGVRTPGVGGADYWVV